MGLRAARKDRDRCSTPPGRVLADALAVDVLDVSVSRLRAAELDRLRWIGSTLERGAFEVSSPRVPTVLGLRLVAPLGVAEARSHIAQLVVEPDGVPSPGEGTPSGGF